MTVDEYCSRYDYVIPKIKWNVDLGEKWPGVKNTYVLDCQLFLLLYINKTNGYSQQKIEKINGALYHALQHLKRVKVNCTNILW